MPDFNKLSSQIPLQQGLRLYGQPGAKLAEKSSQIPLQQGLRRIFLPILHPHLVKSNSTTTRIKTVKQWRIYKSGWSSQIPLQQGLRQILHYRSGNTPRQVKFHYNKD